MLIVLSFIAFSLTLELTSATNTQDTMLTYLPKLYTSQSDTKKVEAMQNMDYKEKMISLIEKISKYSKSKNQSFQLIGNNGLELFRTEEVGMQNVNRILSSVDGILLEGFYYGWEMEDDKRTSAAVRAILNRGLEIPVSKNLPVLNIDYCDSIRKVEKSYQLNDGSNFIDFAASNRELDTIPTDPPQIYNENDNTIRELKQVKNFIALLNPQKFKTKKSYLESLKNTNYDLLIIDMYFDGERLLPSDVESLKVKKNGATRLVFSYMSVGEIENYRPYWKSEWSKNPPKWIAEINPDWDGNFKVKYWNKEWENILFGFPDSYLDLILASKFDGAFMDVIDAFEYFESKDNE